MSEKQKLQNVKKPEDKVMRKRPLTTPKPVAAATPDNVLHKANLNPDALTPADAAQLQRAIGNQAIGKILQTGSTQPPPIQAKLTLGPVGDKYEQEADSVAKQVVSQMNTTGQPAQRQEEEEVQAKRIDSIQRQEEEEEVQAKRIDSIQRQEEEEEVQAKRIDSIQRQEEEEEVQAKRIDSIQRQEEEEEVQAKRIDSIQRQEEEEEVQAKRTDSIQRQEEEEEVQAKRTDSIQRQEEEEEVQAKLLQRQPVIGANGGDIAPDIDQSIQSARGGGHGLADTVRKPMEQSFSADFSDVKIHTDRQADTLNRSLDARAFTTGQDIFFREGEYNPGSTTGQELIAHELTHVVQQKGDAVQRDIKPKSGGIKNITLDVTFTASDVECDTLQAVQVWWGTGNTLGVKVGKMELEENSKTYEAFVDGGKNSPWVTLSGNSPAHPTKPYYLTAGEHANQVKFDKEKKSGSIRVFDRPSAVVHFDEFNFETAIVAVNYKGTGKDKILQTFTWGWSAQGTKPTHEEGDEIDGKPSGIKTSGDASSTFNTIVSNDYSDYKYD